MINRSPVSNPIWFILLKPPHYCSWTLMSFYHSPTMLKSTHFVGKAYVQASKLSWSSFVWWSALSGRNFQCIFSGFFHSSDSCHITTLQLPVVHTPLGDLMVVFPVFRLCCLSVNLVSSPLHGNEAHWPQAFAACTLGGYWKPLVLEARLDRHGCIYLRFPLMWMHGCR